LHESPKSSIIELIKMHYNKYNLKAVQDYKQSDTMIFFAAPNAAIQLYYRSTRSKKDRRDYTS
jgi:hypothetical protein